jgi:hypothetical protein
MTTKTLLEKILKGFLHTKDEQNIAMKGWGLLKLKRKTDK